MADQFDKLWNDELAAIRYEQSRPTPVKLGGVSEQHLTVDKSEPADITLCSGCKFEIGYSCSVDKNDKFCFYRRSA